MPTPSLLFPVSPEREAYNDIRIKYIDIAASYLKDFSNKYDDNFKKIEDIHEKAEGIAMTYLGKAIDVAIRDLIKRGIKDIDEDGFYNKYIVDNQNNPWPEYFTEIDDKYLKIVTSAEELDEYRAARAANRGRWVGGGFGVGGAIKGAATAGAANLAMGALHGGFNLIGKGISAMSDMFEKKELFNSDTTRDTLENGVYYMTLAVHSGYYEALNDYTENEITGYRKQDECSKASRIFENVKKGRITGTEARNDMLEAFSLDPYNVEFYSYWLKTYGDADSLLEDTALHFGIKTITNTKKEMVGDKKSKLDLSTPESCIKSIKILEEYATSIGCKNIEPEKSEINALAKKLDRERRTFNGKVYDSVDAMKSAKAEYEEIQSRTVDGKVYNTTADAKDAQEKFDDKVRRTVNGVTYDTLDQADVEREKKKVGFLLGFCIWFFPPLALITLKKGYSTKARIFSLGYLVSGFMLLIISAIAGK